MDHILALLRKEYPHPAPPPGNFATFVLAKRLGLLEKQSFSGFRQEHQGGWEELNALFSSHVQGVCHTTSPECGKCVLLEFCHALGSEHSYHNNFHCTRCGYCCTLRVYPSETDIRRLTDAGHKPEEFLERWLGKESLRMIDGKCFFLRKEGEEYVCSAYASRPNTCKIYPSYDREITECKEQSRLQILKALP
ncbi:MAG TPA: YkgJ family cysteine cluster protein [Candidatus Nanoarchaeia archaeon]|nr:YkgJ family cysteine cluster protein [Candidatus Nanoarchaeia archaeon]